MKPATRAIGLMFFGGKQAPGDYWGGMAAMLVALPASMAFGMTVYSVLGPTYAAYGAIAGIVGATVIGLVASTLGGTDRLISAPCAPAAAVLAAFAYELMSQGIAPGAIVLLMVTVGIIAGMVQVLLGFAGVGALIKYIPYPVVSGYLTGVGLIIIGSQIPPIFGAVVGTRWWEVLLGPSTWDWRALAIGGATVGVAVVAPRLTQKVPGIILGIAAGLLAYLVLAMNDPALRDVAGNPLVIGPVGISADGLFNSVVGRWREIGDLRLGQIAALFGSALTLAALLSIDTLKTCVVLDQFTRTRHDSNRELVAQGVANIASSGVGGIPGAGTMGATMVNLTSGAQTRASGVFEGAFALVASLILSTQIAWIPVATLAGILIVIGVRMIDREPLRFIESRATVFDFAVVVAVVVVALTIGLIAASAVGVALAILLFVREQIGGSVVRHKAYVNQRSSTWQRPEAEMRILEQKGDQAVIVELQGSLFFGTTQQLYADLERELHTRDYVILDLKRVQSVDVTTAHMLNQARDALLERGAKLILSNVRENLPNGRNLREFLEHTGVLDDRETVRIFPELDSAIAWVEDRLLGGRDARTDALAEAPLQLAEMEIFARHKDETLKDLEAHIEIRSHKAGEAIYMRGQPGDEIYWIRCGSVRIFAPIGAGRMRHIASFGRGDFFGGLAFMDRQPRGNDATAYTDTQMYFLSREQFNQLAETHKRLAFSLIMAISRTLALRLRHADTELATLQEY